MKKCAKYLGLQRLNLHSFLMSMVHWRCVGEASPTAAPTAVAAPIISAAVSAITSAMVISSKTQSGFLKFCFNRQTESVTSSRRTTAFLMFHEKKFLEWGPIDIFGRRSVSQVFWLWLLEPILSSLTWYLHWICLGLTRLDGQLLLNAMTCSVVQPSIQPLSSSTIPLVCSFSW